MRVWSLSRRGGLGVLLAVLLFAGLPAVARAATNASLSTIACASAGNCVAVGSFTESNGAQQGLLLSQIGGSWQRDGLLALPANAAANPGVVLNALWCGSGPDCVVVGDYEDGAGDQEALEAVEHDGTWSAAQEIALPAGAIAGGSQLAELNALWCASVSSCVAVGDYTDNDGNQQGLTVAETAGHWTRGDEPPLPSTAGSNPQVTLTALSCASATDCVVTGVFTDDEGNQAGVILAGAAPAWGDGEPVLPVNAAPAAQQVQLNAFTCPAAGQCYGVGSYIDTSGNQDPLVVMDDDGSFSSLEPALPADADSAASPDAELTAISCPSVGNCTAVGDYTDTNGNQQGLLETAAGGTWAPSTALPAPSGAATNPETTLDAIGCTTTTCTIGGAYTTAAGAQVPLIATTTGTSAVARMLALPTGAPTGSSQTAMVSALACPGGVCEAAGSATAAEGATQALVSGATDLTRTLIPNLPQTGPQLQSQINAFDAAPQTTLAKIARSGLTRTWTAALDGTLHVDWYIGRTLIATVPKTAIVLGHSRKIRLTLTRAGRRLAATRRPQSIRADSYFLPSQPTQNGRFQVEAARGFRLG